MWPLLLAFAGLAPDLEHARFYGRSWSSEHPLELSQFVVFVDTNRETVRSRLLIEVSNRTWARVEAAMRLPIPPGAAVTSAVLYIDERPMAGHLMSSDVAHDAYHSIVDHQLDPMLVAWAGTDAIDVSVFPVEPNGRRRLEIEWVEPAARAQERGWYRLPVIAERGRVVGRPTLVLVDGAFHFPDREEWLPLDLPAAHPRAAFCPAIVVTAKDMHWTPNCPSSVVLDDGVNATDPDALVERARAISAQDLYFVDRRFAKNVPALRQHFPLQTVTGELVWLDPPDRSRDDLEALWARAGGGGVRAVTPDVSLLVLEHEEDYARWAPATTTTTTASAPVRMGARRVSRAPALIMAAAPIVRGALDKQVIRRLVRPRLAEVRHCYELELITNHHLHGRVVLELVFDSSQGGPAVSVRVSESTLDDPAVGNCIVQRAGRWEFPRAEGGGIVEIHYPFVLQPTGE